MKKTLLSAVLTTVLALFSAGLSYAAPAQDTPVTTADTSQIALSQAVTELKTASIPHETVYDADGVKTTFHFEQGLSFTIVQPKPAISAFIGGNWDWGGPYILLNSFDVDMIVGGQSLVIGSLICGIPAIGWGACSTVGLILLIVNSTIRSHWANPCNNRQMKVHIAPPRYSGCE